MKSENDSSMNWEAFVEAFAGPILIIDPKGKIIYVNHPACDLLDKSKDALINENFSFPFDLDSTSEIEILSKNNTIRYAHMFVKNYIWNTKDVYVVTLFDTTQFKLAEKQLRIANNVFKFAKEGIFITDREGMIIDVNDEFCSITGYLKQDVIGKNPKLLSSCKQDKKFYKAMWQKIDEMGCWFGQLWNKKKDGSIYPELLALSVVTNEANDVTNYVGVFYDITTQVKQQQQLEKIAYYDVLTNLPNRNLLVKLLDDERMHASANHTYLAVIYIDIDNLKLMSNKYGQTFGDNLIIVVSALLAKSIGSTDILSRCGDDEFAIVITNMTNSNAYKRYMDELYKHLNAPIPVGKYAVRIGLSAGIALYSKKNAFLAHDLIRQAHRAMYEAKNRGRNQYTVFDSDKDTMEQNISDHLNQLLRAMKNDEFELFFQPKINIKSNKVIGVEALLRWQHPKEGLLVPSQFLPEVLTPEFHRMLDQWVITKAIAQLHKWHPIDKHISISVNINANNLMNRDFMIWLTKLLKKTQKYIITNLEFEILESSMLFDLSKLADIMLACIKLGISFSLDDFGTMYSSLAYVKALPLRYMKIDQSFIKDLLNNQNDIDILKGILFLAKAIKIKVIAEGVETNAHLKLLKEQGCGYAQGYAISKPLQSDAFELWHQRR